MTYKYIIIDGDSQSSISLQTYIASLGEFVFSGYVNNAADGLNLILEENPAIVFLGISLTNSTTERNFSLINELYKYMVVLPKIVIISNTKEVAFEAMKYDVYDFILKPIPKIEIIKTLLKFKKEQSSVSVINSQQALGNTISNIQVQKQTNNEIMPLSNVQIETKEQSTELGEPIASKLTQNIDFQLNTEEIKNELFQLVKSSLSLNSSNGLNNSVSEIHQDEEQKNTILCIKSYGDYRFVEFEDIVYLKADNNSTDIILNNGDSITAFKTLKHFEGTLPSEFMRIHNSHIINIKFVSRIHLGNSDCYLNKGKIKLPFSKSYKDNITSIIELFAKNESKED